jgi:hypothetical protein
MHRKLAVLIIVILACALVSIAPSQPARAFDSPPPPAPIEVAIDPIGSVDSHTGSATVSGVLSCYGTFDSLYLDVTVRQKQGRDIASGESSVRLATPCSWQRIQWQATIRSETMAYKGGAVEVLSHYGGYGYNYQTGYYTSYYGNSTATIQLNGTAKK